MVRTIPGKLQKQGPIATLEGGIQLGYHDKFMFNGEQFVQLVSTAPGILEASANYAVALSNDTQVSAKVSYGNYRDSSGTFRLINGSPTYTGNYTGTPTDTYNHVIIGYDSPVTTSTIKFWAEEYIPVEVLRVDYGYDGDHWYNVATHQGNISFEFDSSLRLYSTETTPVGQYVYTIDLGSSITATYWRIRSFIGMHATSAVSDVEGKNITMSTVSGLPSSSTTWGSGDLLLAYGTVTEYTSPGTLDFKFYKSEGTNAISWDHVYYNSTTGVYTVSGCVLDESSLAQTVWPGVVEGPVTLPGWINNISVWLKEDYNVIKGYNKTPKSSLAINWSLPTSCAALAAEFQFPHCELYDYWYTNISECFFAQRGSSSTYIGDSCYDYTPITQKYTAIHGSFSTDDIFYLSSFSTPFAVTTETYFSPYYVAGDVGPNGGVLFTESMVTSFSGTDPDPGGDPISVGHVGSAVEYTSLGSYAINTCSSNAWSATTDLSAGTLFMYSYPMKATQVKVQQRNVAMLKFWESDGSLAATSELDDTYVYDMVFDSSDGVYYAAIYQPTSSFGSDIDDSFSSSSINSVKWDVYGSAIVQDTTNSGIVFRNYSIGTAVYGSITNNYYYTGNFTATLPVLVTTLSGYNYYGLSFVDYQHNNTAAFIGISGDWGEVSTREVSGVLVGDPVNVSDGSFYISDLSVDVRDLPDGSNRHEFINISDIWYYTRKPEGSLCDVCAQSVGTGPQLTISGVSFKVNTNVDIINYSSFSFTTDKNTITSISTSGIDLTSSFDYSSHLFVIGYNDGSQYTAVSGVVSDLDTYYFSPRISGKTNDIADVFSSEYTSEGSFLRDSSILSIVTIDDNGHRVEVSGVSDANGVVLGSLDVLDEGFGFMETRGRVAISSSQQTEGGGGSIFVMVGEDLYKYNKTTLPLASDDGSTTAMFSKGSIASSRVREFGYDGFVNGGLHYITFDDERDIVVMKELSSSTLLPVTYEVELDITSIDMPLALDPVDLDSLYVVEDGDVYVMNMDSTAVASCNVVVSDPVIPADSGYTSSVTAFVTNLYGDPLQGKTVAFSITSGGGSVSPVTACTTSSGTASTTFTADDTVGTTIITATATNTSC